ncbi:MAG: DUF4846 domain-containing protein [Eubacteriales bacterium]|nr:DUF4846 domain-containing protein [Eubacteriales bacterium]
MKKLIPFLLIIFTLCSCKSELLPQEKGIITPTGNTVEERIFAPDGYEREKVEDKSLLSFLRSYELKPDGAQVLLYNGNRKHNQNAHTAVFALPIEDYDLQQCADSVMRMYAEYFWHTDKKDKVAFHFTDGFLCEYSKWRDGYRPVVGNGATRWEKKADIDNSYENFVKYLKMVFTYAGTASMEALEVETIPLCELDAGDIIIKGGSPGHVVMVVDVCKRPDGKKAFLLAQGYMPAQEFHIIKNPLHQNDPWYYEEEMTFPLKTAEYTFNNESMIKRLTYKGE